MNDQDPITIKCPVCEGKGHIPVYRRFRNTLFRARACPACDGRGEFEIDPALIPQLNLLVDQRILHNSLL